MALSIISTAVKCFSGISTAGGYSFSDLRNLGFFEQGEPVSLGSCYLDYTVGVGSDPYDPVIGVSTYNVGVPSTGTISITNIADAVRELRLDISGSGNKIDLRNLAFGSEQTNNIRKNVFISTDCVIYSDDPNVAALSVTGGYNNLRLTVSGQVLGCGGASGTDATGGNGGNGGDALNITNSLGIGARIQVPSTGQIKAGGGGGGVGEDGSSGSSSTYQCGSQCAGCQQSCRRGCCYDCGGGFACCFNPCCYSYAVYCTATGGSAGQGGAGGLGRGANYPSGSLLGAAGGAGGAGSNGAPSGTPGGSGGAGGDYGQRGQGGNPAPAASPSTPASYNYTLPQLTTSNSSVSATTLSGITGVTSINLTCTFQHSIGPGNGLYPSGSVRIVRASDGIIIAQDSTLGFSGTLSFTANLSPSQTYYIVNGAGIGRLGNSPSTVSGTVTYTTTSSVSGTAGQGGQPGYAITGAYGLAGFVAGIVTGILPEPTYGFTTSANATVGYAGTQQVWEFVSTGTTEISLAKTQYVDLLVVGGGSNVVTGSRGGGGGAVQYRRVFALSGGRYNVSVGTAGEESRISHVDGTTLNLIASGANSSSSQGGQFIEYNRSGGEVTNTVYPSTGSGGDSVVTHGPEGYGGGGGVTQSGSSGSTQSGGPCWKAYNGSFSDCLHPYSANGGKGGNGLQVNARISGTDEYYGSGGGGAAGESSNCLSPYCFIPVTQGAMGPGQYGRGRRPAGQNHGSNTPATQGIVVIKFLDNVP